jgi:hypothetical protein
MSEQFPGVQQKESDMSSFLCLSIGVYRLIAILRGLISYLLTGVSFVRKLEARRRRRRAAAAFDRGAERLCDLPTAPINYPELHSDHTRRLLPQDTLNVHTLKLPRKACVWSL